MESDPEIQTVVSKKSGRPVKEFFYHWSALIVLLYGLLGFLFYFFLLVTGHNGVTTGLPFRALTKETLWIWLLLFAVLHFVVFSGGLLLLLFSIVEFGLKRAIMKK